MAEQDGTYLSLCEMVLLPYSVRSFRTNAWNPSALHADIYILLLYTDLLTRLAQLLLGSGNVGHGDSAEAEERKQPVIELSLQGVANRMKEIGERKSVGEGTTG